MPDNHTPDHRHRNMAAIHSASTKLELRLRTALWRQGFRYRINDKRLPGSPDIVLPKYRTVIFVHGCFWHGHKDCRFYTIPKTNTDFWITKVARNQARDQEVWRQLEAKGWFVIVVWECQLKKAVFETTLANVQSEIIRNGDAFHTAQKERRLARISYMQERMAKRERELAIMSELKTSHV